jgi:glucose-1-phosphate thymidylyltransferase
MKCLILAGGFANRMNGVVKNKPKPLLMFHGKPAISHIIERVPEGIEITVSTNKRFEVDFINWKDSLDRNIELFVEDARTEEEKLGAIKSIEFLINKKNIQEDLLVLAGDNYFRFSLHDFINTYDGINPLVAVCDIGDRQKAQRYGVVELQRNRIVSFCEKPEQPKSTIVAIACYILPATSFGSLSQYCNWERDNLGGFIAYLLNDRCVNAFEFTEPWIDIGHPESYLELQKEVTANPLG